MHPHGFFLGGYEAPYLKISCVDKTGKILKNRHTSAVESVAALTPAVWDAANDFGDYRVKMHCVHCFRAAKYPVQ